MFVVKVMKIVRLDGKMQIWMAHSSVESCLGTICVHKSYTGFHYPSEQHDNHFNNYK